MDGLNGKRFDIWPISVEKIELERRNYSLFFI